MEAASRRTSPLPASPPGARCRPGWPSAHGSFHRLEGPSIARAFGKPGSGTGSAPSPGNGRASPGSAGGGHPTRRLAPTSVSDAFVDLIAASTRTPTLSFPRTTEVRSRAPPNRRHRDRDAKARYTRASRARVGAAGDEMRQRQRAEPCYRLQQRLVSLALRLGSPGRGPAELGRAAG